MLDPANRRAIRETYRAMVEADAAYEARQPAPAYTFAEGWGIAVTIGITAGLLFYACFIART